MDASPSFIACHPFSDSRYLGPQSGDHLIFTSQLLASNPDAKS